MVSVVGLALPQVQAGKVNAVAVLGATRIAQWPQVPKVREAGLDVPATTPGWFAIVGPVGMSDEVLATFNAAMQQTLADSLI